MHHYISNKNVCLTAAYVRNSSVDHRSEAYSLFRTEIAVLFGNLRGELPTPAHTVTANFFASTTLAG
jgi:hypothetical protein